MNWIEFIIAVVTILGGEYLLKLIFYKPSKQKASAEAVSVEKENESTAISTMRNAMEMLNAQLEYANAQVAAKDEVIQAKEATINELTARIQALYDDMCIHKGCKVRMPHKGQGKKYYEDHIDDPGLGCDYYSIETLLKKWRENQRNNNQETEDDRTESGEEV